MSHVWKIFFMANLFSLQNILWKGCETGSWRRSEKKCSTAVYDICKHRTNTLASGNGFSHKSLQNKVNGSSSNHNAGKGGYCTAHALHWYILHTLQTVNVARSLKAVKSNLENWANSSFKSCTYRFLISHLGTALCTCLECSVMCHMLQIQHHIQQ